MAALLLIYGLLAHFIHLSLFQLKEVKVDGALTHIELTEIENIVRTELKGNFFTLNLAEVRRAFEKLPWVKSVMLRRQWPNRLEVLLEEHVALAQWGNQMLVSREGEVFEAASDEALPLLVGPWGSEKEVVSYYTKLSQALMPLTLSVVEMELSSRRAWKAKLNNGLVIEMGRDRAYEKFITFIKVYSKIAANLKEASYVDLRYSNGFAVRNRTIRSKT